MLYPRHFTRLIGFDKIKEEVQNRCLSEQGQEAASSLTFSSDVKEIEQKLAQTHEFKKILELGYTFLFKYFQTSIRH